MLNCYAVINNSIINKRRTLVIIEQKIRHSPKTGELAQLAERVLSMHEVAGSIPAFSNFYTRLLLFLITNSPIFPTVSVIFPWTPVG